MVERLICRLNLTPEEQALYQPPIGVDVVWLNWEKPNIVVAEFVASDLSPDPLLKKTAAQIRHEVQTTLRNRLVDDNLGSYFNSPRRIYKLETFLEHPNVTSAGSGASRELRMAAEAATEVHDVELTKQEFDNLQRPLSGQEITPKEIRRKKRMISERAPDGRTLQRPVGEEDAYVMSFGIIDMG